MNEGKAIFQSRWAGDMRIFLNSPMGKELLELWPTMNASASCPKEPHEAIHRLGHIEGYDKSIEDFISLAVIPKVVKPIEANYGVKPKPEEKPAEK